MSVDYLVGEPIFPDWMEPPTERFSSPVASAQFAVNLRRSVQDLEQLKMALRHEYLAIIAGLSEMGATFRLLYAHPDKVDQRVMNAAVRAGFRLAGMTPDFFTGGTIYPRDFSIRAGRVSLVNSAWTQLTQNQDDLIASPFGEGGRTLSARDIVLVPERIVLKAGLSRRVMDEDLSPLYAAGLRTGRLPLPVAVYCTHEEVTSSVFFNDHLDRAAGLIAGKDGRAHLVLDPCFFTVKWIDEGAKIWELREPEDSENLVREICKPLGIVVHRLASMRVPYALNLIQSQDGCVLMTGGDEAAAGLIGELVGSEKVHTTEIPIIHYPVFANAGIRCLVGDMPPVFRHVG
jgi:hypothetical protein